MNLISVDNISKSVGTKLLFKDISFGIDDSDKVSLIGVNGSGKTSLLKIIAGFDKADSGTVSKNNDCNINYLPQLPQFNSNDTILNHIFKSDSEVVQAIKKYELLCLNPSSDKKYIKELDEMIAVLDRLDAWQFESEIKSILSELGIKDFTQKMGELSGGMLKKVALASALIDSGNLLILDEPTNHLDMDTTIWLESFLKKTKKAILMVTHDRYFMDNVCNKILEIDQNTIFTFSGNFNYYLEKKTEILDSQKRQEERIKNILRTEIKWLKAGVKARTTKQRARIERIEQMQNRKIIKEEKDIELQTNSTRLGKTILEVKNISKKYGDKEVIKPFNYVFKHKEKLGIVGPNGAGKTTFIKLITEIEKSDTGEVKKGVNTNFAIFDQHSELLNTDKRMIDVVKEEKEHFMMPNGKSVSAGQFLEMFLFPSAMHHTPVSKLSGGERRRLHLVIILMKNPNFLILDEPTNDLDIKTLFVLENFLRDFNGCLIVISHDRYFMNKVTEHLLIFDGKGNIDEFPGDFNDYLKSKELKNEEKRTEKIKPNREKKEKVKLTYLEKKEFETIEDEIDELESIKSDLEQKLNEGGTNYSELSELQDKLNKIEEDILSKMERWEYLTEKANQSL